MEKPLWSHLWQIFLIDIDYNWRYLSLLPVSFDVKVLLTTAFYGFFEISGTVRDNVAIDITLKLQLNDE